MASGDTLAAFFPQDNEPPTSAAILAPLDLRNGHPVLDFSDAGERRAYFTGVLPRNYAGGGITVTLIWAASSATSGDVVWEAGFERLEDEGTDIDADSFAADGTVTATA